MRETLVELREGMRRYAAGFDAAVLSPADAQRAVELAASIEGIAATLKALAGARLAEGGAWKASGERSAALAGPQALMRRR